MFGKSNNNSPATQPTPTHLCRGACGRVAGEGLAVVGTRPLVQPHVVHEHVGGQVGREVVVDVAPVGGRAHVL